MMMPTYERRFFIDIIRDVREQQEEEMESYRQRMSSGKGKRTTTLSGDQVKNFARKTQGE